MDDRLRALRSAPIVWPSVILVALAIYGYVNYEPPLESARPHGDVDEAPFRPSPYRGVRSVYARLWEDPFGRRYARPSGAKEDDEGPPPIDFDLLLQPREHERVLVLPVFLSGSPSMDARESRRRVRYAIVSAFTTAFHRPERADQLHYGTFSWTDASCERRQQVLPVEIFRRNQVDPVYDPDRDGYYDYVLVCWLDESLVYGAPLRMVAELLKQVEPTQQKYDCAIIGPWSSDVLLTMANEDAGWTPSHARWIPSHAGLLGRATLYSPRATVDPEYLKTIPQKHLSSEASGETPPEYRPLRTLRNFIRKPNSVGSVARTVGTDRELVRALYRELDLRSAWPRERDAKETFENDCIVLVTERDTLYGRALPILFANMIDRRYAEERNYIYENEGMKGSWPKIMVFKYLRGIDGRLPSDRAPQTAAGTSNRQNGRAAYSERQIDPTGRAQLDYLDRLKVELVKEHERRQRLGGHGITAIGVLGSDVYDKLLVLRALRPHFPAVTFFTTDLDENLARESELGTTRNLIVASHFGLKLHPTLQRNVPPFRDSYQTSVFFSVLLALRDERARNAVCHHRLDRATDLALKRLWTTSNVLHRLSPLVFEMGARGPYQLTRTTQVGFGDVGLGNMDQESPSVSQSEPSVHSSPVTVRIHPPNSWQVNQAGENWHRWLLGLITCAAATVLLACMFAAVRTIVRTIWRALARCTMTLTVIPIVAAAVATLRNTKFHRPRHRRAYRKIRRQWARFHDVCIVVYMGMGGSLLYVIYLDHSHGLGEPFDVWAGISVWPSTLIRFLSAGLSIALIVAGMNDLNRHLYNVCQHLFSLNFDSIREKSWWLLPPVRSRFRQKLLSLMLKDTIRMDLRPVRKKWRRFRLRFCRRRFWLMLKDVCRMELHNRMRATRDRSGKIRHEIPDVPAKVFCIRYVRRGGRTYRLIRFVLLGIVFGSFGIGLFELTEWPNHPTRGQTSSQVEQWVLCGAVAGMIALVFFVLDATQLCRQFVRGLARSDIAWPKGAFSKAGKEWELVENGDIRELLITRAIAARTNVVSKLMIYPFSVLLLMILARHKSLDSWDLPNALLIVLAIMFLALLVNSLFLRRDAARSRRELLAQMRSRLSSVVGDSQQARREQQLRGLILEVEEEHTGAFQPLTSDYVFRAVAIPFGGTGGLLLLDQLLL